MNLYIHVPFCRSKCGYCAFYSFAGSGESMQREYLRRIGEDLRRIKGTTIHTLYIGGGTPTYPGVWFLSRLFGLLRRYLTFAPDCEISIEANPETLTTAKIAVLRSFATRLSVGVQSFDPVLRRRIGRNCSDTALRRALERVREAGFPHFSMDLIYGIPGETMEQWQNDLTSAVTSGCDHLSCYALTPEEGARLASGFEIDDNQAAAMMKMAVKFLKKHGFPRYEVSNFSVRGGECRHNAAVWRGETLTALGPSASGFDGIDRYCHPASWQKWLSGTPPEIDRIGEARRREEIFAVNLRTVSGWTPEKWGQVAAADDWSFRLETARRLSRQNPGWWSVSDKSIRLTARGLDFWDSIACELL